MSIDISSNTLLSVEQAITAVCHQVYCHLNTESVPLVSALGRILAENIITSLSLPPADNSAVDGYGVRVSNATETRLRLVGQLVAAPATSVELVSLNHGEAVRLFTGAILPPGVEAVVMQEECQTDGTWVVIPKNVSLGANYRRTGEDIRRGQLALPAGIRLRPQELGLAAAMGLTTLPVRTTLRTALFSTGNELREPGSLLPPGCIYDANRYALAGMLTALGCSVTDLGILPDRTVDVISAFENAAPGHDLIVTSGGVSVGEEDHVKAAIIALGTLNFWRVKIKPGKPLTAGTVAGLPFLGLPGNPVAAMVSFLIVGRPLVLTLAGRSFILPQAYPVNAHFSLTRSPGRREFLRARLNTTPNGIQQAILLPVQGSAMLSSMTRADGLIDLAETTQHIELGETVYFLPFTELLW